jgi:predicted nuclease of restriction endonuclease-like (RecB) superfamily
MLLHRTAKIAAERASKALKAVLTLIDPLENRFLEVSRFFEKDLEEADFNNPERSIEKNSVQTEV